MVPAIYATTVNPIQNNAKMENGITAFTVTCLSLCSCAACGVLATAGTACDATPRAARLSGLTSGLSLAVRPAGLAEVSSVNGAPQARLSSARSSV